MHCVLIGTVLEPHARAAVTQVGAVLEGCTLTKEHALAAAELKQCMHDDEPKRSQSSMHADYLCCLQVKDDPAPAHGHDLLAAATS
jgi:hypothetical protein